VRLAEKLWLIDMGLSESLLGAAENKGKYQVVLIEYTDNPRRLWMITSQQGLFRIEYRVLFLYLRYIITSLLR